MAGHPESSTFSNHLGSLEIPSFSSFFQKTAEAGLACATRLRVSWVTWPTVIIYHATACYFLLLMFRGFPCWGVFSTEAWRSERKVEPWTFGESWSKQITNAFCSRRKAERFSKFETFQRLQEAQDFNIMLVMFYWQLPLLDNPSRLAYSGCDFPRIFRPATASRCMSTRAASRIWSCEAGAIRVLEGHFLQDSSMGQEYRGLSKLRVFGIFLGPVSLYHRVKWEMN